MSIAILQLRFGVYARASGLVEYFHSLTLGDVPLSRNFDLCASLRVDFTTTQTPCCELTLAVPDNAAMCFGWHYCLDALQDWGEALKLIETLEAGLAKQMESIDTLQSHDPDLLDENRLFDNN